MWLETMLVDEIVISPGRQIAILFFSLAFYKLCPDSQSQWHFSMTIFKPLKEWHLTWTIVSR
jgi:hypothetical protein